MNRHQILIALTAVIEADYEQACADFKKVPGGDAWAALEQAMWAMQGLNQIKQDMRGESEAVTTTRLLTKVDTVGVGYWVTLVAGWQQGKLEV